MIKKNLNFLNYARGKERIGAALAVAAFLLIGFWAASSRSTVSQAQNKPTHVLHGKKYVGQVPDKVKHRISHLGGGAMRVAALTWGLKEIMGKPLSDGAVGAPGNANARKLRDVGIGVDPIKFEDEPSVAANPKDKKNLVAGSHSFNPNAIEPPFVRCVAYNSFDGGATWSSPIPMPHLNSPFTSNCADPVLAFAPDGSRVYYAYMDIKEQFIELAPDLISDLFDYDIVVSYSDDGGKTWTGPVTALDGDPGIINFNPFTGELIEIPDEGFIYDKPWVGTHVDATQSSHVYVTATKFDQFGEFLNHIAFTHSSAQGTSWGSPAILDTGGGFPFALNQGSRPTGGLGGEVLVAWFNSGPDGLFIGSFNIRTRRSGDHGVTWDPVVDASIDSFEAPVFIGPFIFYYVWWPSMFPDVEIDSGGSAHIVYTHDPEENVGCPPPFDFPGCSTTTEDGDIRYISSAGPPYASWSAPVTVSDDNSGRAQGFPALKIQREGNSDIIHVIWDDHRLSPDLPTSTIENCQILLLNCDSPNLYYDIFYSRKIPGKGAGWSKNLRVTDTSSIDNFFFQGDYMDLAANDKLVFGIWTDRRHQTNIGVHDGIIDFAALENNVFGSRIIAGGGAP